MKTDNLNVSMYKFILTFRTIPLILVKKNIYNYKMQAKILKINKSFFTKIVQYKFN